MSEADIEYLMSIRRRYYARSTLKTLRSVLIDAGRFDIVEILDRPLSSDELKERFSSFKQRLALALSKHAIG
jgi:hypothetical protein